MYSRFQLARKYVRYFLNSSNGKGHGVHSPFVYDFIIHVLNVSIKDRAFKSIEQYRKRLLKDKRIIEVEDFGAGSAVISTNKRGVKDIAASSPKNKKSARLLFRIAKYYGCKNIVELGTSFGTTTAYLSLSSPEAKVTTLEGAKNIAAIAEQFFKKNNFENIELIKGNFKKTIPEIIKKPETVDLLFVDGNHQQEATIQYYTEFLLKAHNDSIFVFDDIHWSEGMENAWERIKEHEAVTLTIDLFFVGLVFFKKEFLVKQHFSIRF